VSRLDAADDKGDTALHRAALQGHVSCLRHVVTCGAKLDYRSADRATPLMYASKKGQSEACAVLLELGADPMAADRDHETSLHYGACSGRQRLRSR
jgi:ankyrin repeat protein